MTGQQPVAQVLRRTETGEAPGRQGARSEKIGNIRPTSNAASGDASPVECRGTCATGCPGADYDARTLVALLSRVNCTRPRLGDRRSLRPTTIFSAISWIDCNEPWR